MSGRGDRRFSYDTLGNLLSSTANGVGVEYLIGPNDQRHARRQSGEAWSRYWLFGAGLTFKGVPYLTAAPRFYR